MSKNGVFVIIMWIVSDCDEFMIAIDGNLGWSKLFAFLASVRVLL